ncbi:hypothetical protein, partial [Streptomyces sp. BE303]|uniref:hypothetical protein n=1 Tax=Streptomyces sp. BE303 TaxID=3002528 RepID=UPI002E7A817C
ALAHVAEVLEAFPDVDVAVVNGPGAVVGAGLDAVIAGVGEAAGGRGWKSSRLLTSHAFHSLLM